MAVLPLVMQMAFHLLLLPLLEWSFIVRAYSRPVDVVPVESSSPSYRIQPLLLHPLSQLATNAPDMEIAKPPLQQNFSVGTDITTAATDEC